MEVCGLGRRDMTGHAPRAERPIETMTSSELLRDAQILQKAMRKSIAISPHAFLKTIDDVDEKAIDYWVNEILSSTWAVIEKGEEVLGIAAAKWPDREMDIEEQDTARFIESVWIAPEFRGYRMGERLVKYLIEVERRKNPDIRQFLLWVFDENHPAKRMYWRLGFEYTAVQQRHDRVGITEVKYRLTFNSAMVKAIDTAVNEAARRADMREFGVRYRILGEDIV